MENQNTIQNLIFNILMGKCPRCGERLEFSAGRCARTYNSPEPTNLQELETKLTDWLTKNEEEIKNVLAQQRDAESQTRNFSWRDYDPDVEQDFRRAEQGVVKLCMQLCDIIPVLGRIHTIEAGNNIYNHLLHILKQLYYKY